MTSRSVTRKGRRGEKPPCKFFALWKNVLDMVYNYRPRLRRLSPLLVSKLVTCLMIFDIIFLCKPGFINQTQQMEFVELFLLQKS